MGHTLFQHKSLYNEYQSTESALPMHVFFESTGLLIGNSNNNLQWGIQLAGISTNPNSR
jgi:hypothetical protein